MSDEVRAAFVRLFELAEGHGSGAAAARALLCAWWSASVLGRLDPRELWSLDQDNRHAAGVVMLWFMDRNGLEGTEFDAPMRALARRRVEEIERATGSEP